MGCYEEERASDYGFYSATTAYLSTDVDSINFEDLDKSKYNDLVYKNILVKFTIFQVYPRDVSNFKLSNLDGDTLNALCLASVFIEKYKPLDVEIDKSYGEIIKELIDSRSLYLGLLQTKKLVNVKYNCMDLIK